jgi:hypothetical protein
MWDIFISHAWEDKEEIARPLAEALTAEGLHVWYDEFELTVGDSLGRSIDRGLNDSRYGVVILSPHFFAKEWPQKELDGLSAREIQSVKVILPVWHNVTYDDVLKFSPKLADRLAVRTDKGLAEVVRQLLRACPKPAQPDPERQAQLEQPKPQQPAKKQPLQKPHVQETPKANVIRLRSEPMTVSLEEAQKVFQLAENWRPLNYIQHKYEAQRKVVVDPAIGLMWQKSGSDNYMTYEDAQQYIENLNRQKFADYSDWRLPTIPELMSLLEPTEKNGNLYIDPVFDATQRWCWSTDLVAGSAESAWRVHFHNGGVHWGYLINGSYVRGVRS